MEFSIQTGAKGLRFIKVSGKIVPGDKLKFESIAQSADKNPRDGLRIMAPESPGGDVSAALELASAIERSGFKIFVTGDCASACASIVYPAGEAYLLMDDGRLGYHGCSKAGGTLKLRRAFPL